MTERVTCLGELQRIKCVGVMGVQKKNTWYLPVQTAENQRQIKFWKSPNFKNTLPLEEKENKDRDFSKCAETQ